MSEVNTGDTFVIQNISDDKVSYCVSDTKPNKNVHGRVLLPYKELTFKKATGLLWIKQHGDQDSYIHAECLEV